MTADRSTFTAHGFFITGTDTGVGKTFVACALLHALAGRGLRVIGMKPVAAGARMESGGLVNEDASALQAASNVSVPYALVNPYCFEPPVAPHIAAKKAGVAIDLETLTSAYAELASRADCVVVEGAGGFCVPLGPTHDMRQLAERLRLPVVLVVGMRLGCINHALLTAAAVSAAGLRLAGWVANHIDPDMLYANESLQCLEERLAAPLVGRLDYARSADAQRMATLLDTAALIRHAYAI